MWENLGMEKFRCGKNQRIPRIEHHLPMFYPSITYFLYLVVTIQAVYSPIFYPPIGLD